MSLEHFGFPCENPKDTGKFDSCPRCGATLYDGDMVYTDIFSGDLVGCMDCLTRTEHETEEEEE